MELMAAKEFGYKLCEWDRESKRNRGEMIAWVMESNIREAMRGKEYSEKSKKSDGNHGRMSAADASNLMRNKYFGL